MNLKKNFFLMFASKAVFMATFFFAGSLINRSLGPSGQGIVAEMQTWLTLFVVIFGVSMDTAIYHFANRELYGLEDKSKFMTSFCLSIFFALLGALALTIFISFFPEYVSTQTSQLFLFLDVLLILTILATNLIVFMQALGKIKSAARVIIIQSLVYVIVIGYGYLYNLIDVRFFLISLIIFQLAGLVMILAVSVKANLSGGYFSRDLAKSMVSAGIKQHAATISSFLYTKINQLIVFKYCGASEAGIFAVALNLAFALMIIPSTFQLVLYPRVIHSKDDFDISIKSLRLVFYGWGIVVALVIFLANPILLLYGGGKFLPGVNVFRILMVSVWFLPLSSLVAPFCIKAGAFNACSVTAVLLSAISIGLNLLLVPHYSGWGAALSTALTAFIGFCMALWLLWFLSKKDVLGFLKILKI